MGEQRNGAGTTVDDEIDRLTTGQKPNHTPAGDESSDDQDADFVLSEESLSDLPPKLRAIAARTLRVERENADLRARLATSDDDDDDTPAAAPARNVDAIIKEILDREIPDEGYEALTPGLKKILGAVLKEHEELRGELDRYRSESAENKSQDAWATFKRDNKDWKQYDDAMYRHFKTMGVSRPSRDQLQEVYDLVSGAADKPRLQRELESARKGGPAPKMKSPTPSMSERLLEARTKRTGNSTIGKVVESQLRQTLRANPIQLP